MDAYLLSLKKVIEDCIEKAEQGDVEAQYNLGTMYYEGKGIEQSDEKAFYWWLKAAEQGHMNAQFQVAFAYYCADGVQESLESALEWWEKAAAQGHKPSKNYLENLKG